MRKNLGMHGYLWGIMGNFRKGSEIHRVVVIKVYHVSAENAPHPQKYMEISQEST